MQNYFLSVTLLHDIFSWTPHPFVSMRSVSRTAWKNKGTGAGLSPAQENTVSRVGGLSQPHPNFHPHGPTAFNRAYTHLPLRPLLSSHLPLPHSTPLLPLSSPLLFSPLSQPAGGATACGGARPLPPSPLTAGGKKGGESQWRRTTTADPPLRPLADPVEGAADPAEGVADQRRAAPPLPPLPDPAEGRHGGLAERQHASVADVEVGQQRRRLANLSLPLLLSLLFVILCDL
jgi:hypothetical protein